MFRQQIPIRQFIANVPLFKGFAEDDLERITARGATFVPKPVTSNQLLQTVLRAVASRRAASDSR